MAGQVTSFRSKGVSAKDVLSPLTFLFFQQNFWQKQSGRMQTEIKPLMVNDTEIKLSQYADDTTLILDGSEKSLSEALRVLESFEKVSGLRLNSKKIEAL